MQFSSSQMLTVDVCPNPKQIRTWCSTITQSLTSLFETGSNSIDFATLLHLQYMVVTNNGAAMLYHQLSQEIDRKVLEIKSKLDLVPPSDFTQTLSATWRHYLYVIDALRAFCPHLEQCFSSPGCFFSLSDHAFKRWHLHILSNTSTLNTISNVLLAVFNVAREADGVLPNYVTNMASMLTLLDPLTHSVGTFFIEDRYIQDISLVCGTRRTQLILASQKATEDYEKMLETAKEKAAQKLDQNGQNRPKDGNPSSTPEEDMANFDQDFMTAFQLKNSYVVDYCQKVELWIAQEMALCQQVLSSTTAQRVKALLMEELIAQADAVLLEDQFDGLLYHFKHYNIKQVEIIYHALVMSGSDVSLLADEIKLLIKTETNRVILQANKLSNPVIFVNSIYSIFNRYSQVIQLACHSNAAMMAALQNSIEVAVGSANSSPRLLALYIDQLTRTALQTIGLTNMTDIDRGITHQKTQKALDEINEKEREMENETKKSKKARKNRHVYKPTLSTLPLQVASTYSNTLSPTSIPTSDRQLLNSPHYKSALQARWRVLYELEIQIAKWLELTKFVIDKDLYEENHRMLCVERLLSNIHLNRGYQYSQLTMTGLSLLLTANPSSTNGSFSGLSSTGAVTSFPAISIGNAITTAISQGIANGSPNQANAVANQRFLEGLSSTNAVTPAVSGLSGEYSGPSTSGGGRGVPIGVSDIFSQVSSLKLFLFLSRNPHVPLFILFEYYLCGKLASPAGPGVSTQHFESLFRDVCGSAGLAGKFEHISRAREAISHSWQEYVTALRSRYVDDDVDAEADADVMDDGVSAKGAKEGTSVGDGNGGGETSMGDGDKEQNGAQSDQTDQTDQKGQNDQNGEKPATASNSPQPTQKTTFPNISAAHLQATQTIGDMYKADGSIMALPLVSKMHNTVTTNALTALSSDPNANPNVDATADLTPKSLYPIPFNFNKKTELFMGMEEEHEETRIFDLPEMIPLVVTQGVWNTSISPTLPSNFIKIPAPSGSSSKMSAHLLKTSHFLYPNLKIPFEVLVLLNLYQEQYTSKWFTARKMVWNYGVSTAVVAASFKHPQLETVKTYDLVCSFFQLLILNLFNHKPTYTYAEIVDLTGIISPSNLEEDTMHLHSALLSMSHPKVGILTKSPNTPLINPSDQFSWNHSFSHSTQTFNIPKINAGSLKAITAASISASSTHAMGLGGTGIGPSQFPSVTSSTSSQPLSTNDNPSAQTLFRRATAVDAAIVRIMKRNKEMSHFYLLVDIKADLARFSSFQPDDAFIKQRIENQIDQFNIERDEDDRKLYRYL